MAEMTIKEKLSCIQSEMNVPKNLYNKFGNYNYRNAETILENAKPVCKKYRTTLTIRDEIHVIGDRYYIEAIAELTDWDSPEVIKVNAFAREAVTKKGMDEAQITGSTSSYARKYALKGLFDLDDNKDPDTEEYKNQQVEQQPNKDKQREELLKRYAKGYKALAAKGFDFHNEQFIGQCKADTKLPTLDIQKLDNSQLKTLVDYFVHIYTEA